MEAARLISEDREAKELKRKGKQNTDRRHELLGTVNGRRGGKIWEGAKGGK
jgi:hypothetical protein